MSKLSAARLANSALIYVIIFASILLGWPTVALVCVAYLSGAVAWHLGTRIDS